jgi:hypothetical protein
MIGVVEATGEMQGTVIHEESPEIASVASAPCVGVEIAGRFGRLCAAAAGAAMVSRTHQGVLSKK